MKFQRLFDFAILLICVDALDVILRVVAMVLGAEPGDTVLHIVSMVAMWMKIGMLLLVFRNLPCRSPSDTSVAVRKVLVLSFFWPLVIGHPSLSWKFKE